MSRSIQSKSEKLGKTDYLKCADCEVDLEIISNERYKPTVIEPLFSIRFKVDFTNDIVPWNGHWNEQIYHNVMNELSAFPHVGIPDDWRIQMCVDDNDKSGLYIKLFISDEKFRSYVKFMIVGNIKFSNRQFIGDHRKAFLI